jgi:hypothetical protein
MNGEDKGERLEGAVNLAPSHDTMAFIVSLFIFQTFFPQAPEEEDSLPVRFIPSFDTLGVSLLLFFFILFYFFFLFDLVVLVSALRFRSGEIPGVPVGRLISSLLYASKDSFHQHPSTRPPSSFQILFQLS